MKFKYGDKVKVVKGFFKGNEGIIKNHYSALFNTDYKVKFKGFVAWVNVYILCGHQMNKYLLSSNDIFK